jgi:Flp pilus assembly secretin CpaC
VSDLPAAQSAPVIAAEMLPELQAGTPSSTSSAPSAPDATRALEKLAPTRRVIQVSALKLPISRELPAQYRHRAVSADTLAPSLPPLPRLAQGWQRGQRRAQTPGLPPARPRQPVTNSDRLPNQIEVAVSTFVVLLTTTDLQTVAVADPTIADVAVINSRAVLVNGKAPGITSLVVVDGTKIRQYQVRVVSAPGRGAADIAAQIGLPGVTVRSAGDALVLEGEVNTADESRRAAEVAGAYATRVINQLFVRETNSTENSLASQIQNTIGLPNVRVRSVNDTVFLDGTVESAQELARATAIAQALSKNVVNLITLPRITIDQARESITGSAAQSSPDSLNPTPLSVRQVGDQFCLQERLGRRPPSIRLSRLRGAPDCRW